MYNIFFLGIALSLAAFIVSIWVLLVLLGEKRDIPQDLISAKLSEDEGLAEQVENTPFLEQLKRFTKRHRWEIFLGFSYLLIIIFAWIYAPPRLNGEIATSPNLSGRPFLNLRWGKDFLSNHYNMLWSWGSTTISVFLLIISINIIKKRSRKGVEFMLLAASLNLGFLGQWLLLEKKLHPEILPILGLMLYFIAIFGFGLWAWISRKRLHLESGEKKQIVKKNIEIIFILALLLLTSFARLYALDTIPYGIEGDEAKWTSEAVRLGILGTPDASGEFHRDALPLSFYIQTPLHRLLGPSLFAARLTVVILSILGTLLFYFFLRQITSFPLAALASSLLAISIFDISASRLANVESFVKTPPILTLALLAWAIKTRRWQIYGLSGIALALGILTYDTVLPLLGLTFLIALVELARQKEPFLERTKAFAALFTPTIISLPLLIPYFTSRFSYYQFGEKGFDTDTVLTLWTYFENIISSWFLAVRLDFLYNRQGPLINAIFLPFLLLGLITALVHIKKKAAYWNLLWAILFIFPIPILTNSPFGRVYYPALPAIYFFVGLGIYAFWMELDAFLGKNLRPLLLGVTLLPLIWVPLFNFYLYFNEVTDYSDRQMRREIGEFAAQIADEESLILLPAMSGENTPLNNEIQTLELYMLQKIAPENLEDAYRYITPSDMLNEIQAEKDNYEKIEILFDPRKTPNIRDELSICYPKGRITEGKFFTIFTLGQKASEGIECTSASLSIEASGNNELYWNLKGDETQDIQLFCEKRDDEFQWIEAENLPMPHAWQPETNFAPEWTGTGFAGDHLGSAPLFIERKTEQSQEVYIWVRYYKRTVEENPVYLDVGGNRYPFAEVPGNQLNTWLWERLGPFDIKEETGFSIEHKGDEENFRAFFIDSLVITSNILYSPEREFLEDVSSPLEFSFNTPKVSGFFPLNFSRGIYQCQATIESILPILEEDGGTILYSNIVEINIR